MGRTDLFPDYHFLPLPSLSLSLKKQSNMQVILYILNYSVLELTIK